MKKGVLRETTRIHTVDDVVLKIRRRTKVYVDQGKLTFNPVEGVEAFKLSGEYFVNLWGQTKQVTFPEGGSTPYPFSML